MITGNLKEDMMNFDKDSVTVETLRELQKLTRFSLFRPHYMKNVSKALEMISFWVLSIDQYCSMKGMI